MSATKWSIVGRDVHVREVMDQVTRLQPCLKLLDRYAVLTVKACGVLARKSSMIVTWLHANGFDIVDAWTTQITPDRSRTLWRWQLEKATRQRLWVMDNILGSTETLVLILRDRRDSPVPATTWLSQNKGPANQDKQRTGQLRFVLKPTCYLLNYVHTCDDPVDMLRDIYVLGGMDKVTALCSAVNAGDSAPRRCDIWNVIAAVESNAPVHDLALQSSIAEITQHWPRSDSPHNLELLDRIITDEFTGQATESNILVRCSPIDIAVYVAHRFEMSVPNACDPFESVSGTN